VLYERCETRRVAPYELVDKAEFSSSPCPIGVLYCSISYIRSVTKSLSSYIFSSLSCPPFSFL
jgi:hypothetical protein